MLLQRLRNVLHYLHLFGAGYVCNILLVKAGIKKSNYLLQREKILIEHPELYPYEINYLYKRGMGKNPDLENPKKFTEKLQWLKLHDSTPIKTKLADKYLVREWVSEKIGSEHIIPIYNVWDNFDDINFSELPEKFVLKCNHDSGSSVVIKDKAKINITELRRRFEKFLSLNYGFASMELFYSDIPRKIIAEKYIQELDGGLLDYKIHCFGGKPEFIQVIGERDLINHTGRQRNYNFQWQKLSWIFEDYPEFKHEIEKPSCLDELYRYAEILSRDFKYVRVDFYVLQEKILFGEMTFAPASGIYPYKGTWTEKRDLELGEKISLD